VTTLSIKALGPDLENELNNGQIGKIKAHLLSIQYKTRHSFNNSLPGGWGWTNYSGSVPDVDDTCGAILALLDLYKGTQEEITAIINGCHWLLAQQNKDGGFPTFCKGWGRLPFDSSCSDLTGHAFCALMKTIEMLDNKLPSALKSSFYNSALKGLDFLKREQQKGGAWLPLWFGNQLVVDKTNPVYGTAKVAIYLKDCLDYKVLDSRTKSILGQLLVPAEEFLLNTQNDDGSWGGAENIPGSVEETSLAISALSSKYITQCLEGLQWLSDKYQTEGLSASPIGLYFAALWYDEKLYPLIYYIEALRRVKGAI
jgi:squalene-hopene/tetraprenyl-beta-curcumene cyclase